ncbi:uncharacterized protein DKFZp434B061 [Carassius auratus]|uniref:Uncharacterized protein DKFZp434B061 n=1 Tax=Carassius auratus TaxID=7957 RepID=A0A6P6QVJ1_CARAU|nr:uncharacterized protein DKFZp434B061-like [Carassius auratus]
MRGLDHLSFGEFVEFVACSPAKEAAVLPVVPVKAAVPPVVDEGAAVPPEVTCDTAEPLEVNEETAAPHSCSRRRGKKRNGSSPPLPEVPAVPPEEPDEAAGPQRCLMRVQRPSLGDGGGEGERLAPSHMALRPFRSPLLAWRPFQSCPSSLPCRRPPSSLPCRGPPSSLPCRCPPSSLPCRCPPSSLPCRRPPSSLP